MVNKILQNKYFFKIFIFIPVVFYFGKRSYIAFDEGFYALQARWILDRGNWTVPLWWNEYVLDRTIGLQFLIAFTMPIIGIEPTTYCLRDSCSTAELYRPQ